MNSFRSTLVRSRPAHRSAFSLIELTAVLALMALLATFVTLSVRHVMVKGKQNAARSQIAALRDAVEEFHRDTGHYPTSDQGLAVLTKSPGKNIEPLLRQVPLDPWNHPYVFENLGKNEPPFEIISLGADGREGGDGADLDISSSDPPAAP